MYIIRSSFSKNHVAPLTGNNQRALSAIVLFMYTFEITNFELRSPICCTDELYCCQFNELKITEI